MENETINGRYQAILNSMEEAFALCQLIRNESGCAINFKYLEFNAAFEKQRKLDRGHFLGRTANEVHPNLDPWWLETYQQVVDEQRTARTERFFAGRWFEIKISPLGDDLFSVIFNDVTERKQNEIALRGSEERISKLLALMPAAVYTCDAAGRITYFNRRAAELWGREPCLNEDQDKFCGSFRMWTPEGEVLMHEHCPMADAVMEGRPGRNLEVVIEQPSGSRIVANVNIDPLYDVEGRLTGAINVFTDITESKRAAQALLESRRLLARDLGYTRLLQQISNHILEENDVEALYHSILRSAMELMEADFASVQLLDAEKKELVLLAHENFHPGSANFWQTVSADSSSSCAQAFVTDERVVVTDIDNAPFEIGQGDYQAYCLSGIKAVQSTPLISRAGNHVGMMSTHWKTVHRPSERELDLFDVVARQVADLLERKKAKEEARKSEEKYRTLFNTIDQGFQLYEVLYDEGGRPVDFRYLETNHAFEQQTGLKNVAGKLGSQVTPNLESYWFDYFEQILKSPVPLLAENYNEATGRWYSISSFRAFSDGRPIIGALFNDITERKRNEARQKFLLNISDSLGVADSLKDVQTTVTNSLHKHFDAGWCYYVEWDEEKKAGVVLYDSKRDDLLSLSGTHDVSDVPGFLELLRSGQLLNVSDYENYELLSPEIRERYIAAGFRSMLVASLVKHGRLISSLIIGDTKIRNWSYDDETLLVDVAERTWAAEERAKAEEALKKSEEKYRTLFNTMEEALAVCEVVRDDAGEVIDLTYLAFNTAHERQTGLDGNAMIGRKLSEVLTKSDVERFIPIYARVANTGEPADFEEYVDFTGRWYAASAYPHGKELSIFYRDITERKRHEQRQDYLLKLNDLLRPLSDAVEIEAIACRLLGEHLKADRVFYSEFNEAEGYMKVNRDYLGGNSFSLAGTYPISAYAWAIPLYHQGQPIAFDDIHHTDLIPPADVAAVEAAQIASYCVVPLIKDDVLVGTFTASEAIPRKWTEDEIALVTETAERIWAASERAKAEEALCTSEARALSETARLQATLQSISDAVYIGDSSGITIANRPALEQLGYSDYDDLNRHIGTLSVEIQTRDAQTNEIISPEGQAFARALAGEHVTQDVRVSQVKTGQERILRSAASPVIVDGKIVAAVAVNTDITEQWEILAALRESEQKLREFNESLEEQVKERTAELAESRDRQQREIFEVTLSTLEEERHRISESLHNGLGQVLYGVKISLENLKRELPEGEFDKTRAYTGKLVSNAIQEARRISHELMPTILEEFGLRDAISDIAHQLQDGVKFKFRMTGQKGRLEKYLELAVYRTVQELMTNVVKHANATEASVNINAKKNEIIISVSDNGQGIGASKAEKTGIGLASIRSKIKLLNGNVNIISVPGMGTHIEVIIPRTGGS